MPSVAGVDDADGAALYIDKYLLVQLSDGLTYIMSTGWVGEGEQEGAQRRHAARVVSVG
jgi:hypothetical protein